MLFKKRLAKGTDSKNINLVQGSLSDRLKKLMECIGADEFIQTCEAFENTLPQDIESNVASETLSTINMTGEVTVSNTRLFIETLKKWKAYEKKYPTIFSKGSCNKVVHKLLELEQPVSWIVFTVTKNLESKEKQLNTNINSYKLLEKMATCFTLLSVLALSDHYKRTIGPGLMGVLCLSLVVCVYAKRKVSQVPK